MVVVGFPFLFLLENKTQGVLPDWRGRRGVANQGSYHPDPIPPYPTCLQKISIIISSCVLSLLRRFDHGSSGLPLVQRFFLLSLHAPVWVGEKYASLGLLPKLFLWPTMVGFCKQIQHWWPSQSLKKKRKKLKKKLWRASPSVPTHVAFEVSFGASPGARQNKTIKLQRVRTLSPSKVSVAVVGSSSGQ